MKLYHPQYSNLFDTKTGIAFSPELIGGYWVAVAEVDDEAKQADLLRRGFKVLGGVVEATPLPEDFPARDLLTEAGYDTLEALSEATDDDLLAIKGIGKASLAAIRDELNGV